MNYLICKYKNKLLILAHYYGVEKLYHSDNISETKNYRILYILAFKIEVF